MSSECCVLHAPGQGNILSAFLGNDECIDEIKLNDAIAYGHDIIGNLNSGMNRWLDWNLCVDENGGPRHVPFGFTAPVIADKNGGYRKTPTLDYISCFSKNIKRSP